MTDHKKMRQCVVCGHRFSHWHIRAPKICKPCGEIAFEIARVAGTEFVTAKAILCARNRQLLPQPILAASTASRRKEIQTTMIKECNA
ncbi:hypothetical protein [Collimonas silvisoli]|uniref:hypothetical protein n=1 Tax=Collimonas silvisoli TaxID=2825884 RepID=UPI001B8D2878|nr:hypothetical protein [Collimonas silvisoli]